MYTSQPARTVPMQSIPPGGMPVPYQSVGAYPPVAYPSSPVTGAPYVNGGTYGPEDMFLFVNPGSGGNKGKIFLDAPKPFIVECPDRKKVNLHIFSMLEGSSGNKPGFHKLREVCSRRPGTPVRAIVGGGDGTVMWADSEATKHGIQTPTQVAWGIVPLGTGNDFSRVAGWGGNNPEGIDENNWELLKTLVMRWANATVRHHDVWEVTINLDHGDGQLLKIGKEQVEEDLEVVSKTFYMVNYFSIGQESQVGMHFDKHRTKSQTCNLFVYGAAGFVQELRCWGVQHVGNIVANLYTGTTKNPDKLILDSEGDAGEPQLIGNPESLMFLNISSYAGGKAHLWQSECDVGVDPPPPSGTLSGEQDPGDGKLEVVTLPLIANIAMDNLVHQARRVCQGESYFLEYFKNDDGMNIYFEVDGEFYHAVNPDSTVVKLYKKLQVLQKNKLDVEESDSDWLDDFVPESMGCSC